MAERIRTALQLLSCWFNSSPGLHLTSAGPGGQSAQWDADLYRKLTFLRRQLLHPDTISVDQLFRPGKANCNALGP